MISMESETSAVKVSIIKSADPVKRKVYFCYYLLAKGIRGILSYTKEGVRLWFRTKRPAYRQICRFRSCLLNQWNTGVSKPTEKCSPGDWKFRTTME